MAAKGSEGGESYQRIAAKGSEGGEEGSGGGGQQLDAVLAQLGALGRHQLLTLGMLALVYATNSMYNVNYVFAVEDVHYRCKIPWCENSSAAFLAPTPAPWQELEDGKQCTHRVPPGCGPPEAGAGAREEPCADWVYDVPDSFVAEFGLACQEWKPVLVGTVHSFGSMLGQLLQGQISDRVGRKRAAVFAGSAGAALGLAKSCARSYWGYVALEGLEAAVGDALSPMFMLSIELVEKKRAVLIQMILLNCYTGGLILMPLVAWAFPYWRTFLRVIYAPTLLVLSYALFLDESVRWLLSKGRRAEAVRLLLKIARRNRVRLDEAALARLRDDGAGDGDATTFSDKKALLQTFRSRVMMQRFLVCLAWWLTVTLINYGMMVGAVFVDGNKYVNFALLMMMDIPANVLYWLALDKYRRKLPLVVSFLVGGLFCVSQPFVPKGYAWLGLVLLMAFETLATFSYNIVYMYTSELFPTYTRNSMHSICSAAGRLSALLAPQTPLLMSLWPGLPSLIFGVSSLACGALTLLMPETAASALPDTVAQAERLGRRRPASAPLLDPAGDETKAKPEVEVDSTKLPDDKIILF